jgi:hypothetical protein
MLLHQLVKSCFFASKVGLVALFMTFTLTTGATRAGEGARVLPTVQKTAPTVATRSSGLANGTYLYGESNVPGRLGSEYVVFDNQEGRAIGAVFLANSEYSCFSGQVQNRQLKMMVLDSYAEVEQPYTIDLESEVTSENSGIEYRSLKQIGVQEMSLLNNCRQIYRDRFSRLSIRG